MPSFARNLETTLHNALAAAAGRKHEYATLEHLLLALIDDQEGSAVMVACGVDTGELKSTVTNYLDSELEALRTEGQTDPSPTSGFQRVVQRGVVVGAQVATQPDQGASQLRGRGVGRGLVHRR